MGEIEVRGKGRALRVRSSRGAVVRATSSIMALAIIGAWVGWGGASAGGGINRPTKNPAPSYNAPSAPTLTATPSDSSASLSTTAFSGDAGDTHASSDWWITRESTPSDTVWSAFTSDSLTSYANAGASIPLATDTTYVAHVRHTGSLGGASAEAVDTFTTTTLNLVANEPAGYTRVVNRTFNSIATSSSDRGDGAFPDAAGGAEGWDGSPEYSSSYLSLDTVAGAPVDDTILKVTYPAGWVSGSPPGAAQQQVWSGSAYNAVGGPYSFTKMYTSLSFKYSAGFQAETSTDKIAFFKDASGNTNPYLVTRPTDGTSSGNLSLRFNMQGTPENATSFGSNLGDLVANVSGSSSTDVNNIQRGSFYWVEIVAVMNTVGSDNGTFDLYLGKIGTDNVAVHVMHYTNLTWRSSAIYWGYMTVGPNWGGNDPGQSVSTEQYMWFGHFYSGGAN